MAKKMGGSQSKFKPEAQDVWFRMKVTGKQPKYLQTVMQAIADLRESKGSSQSALVEHIRGVVDAKNYTSKPRNVTTHVKKALKHAVEKGLVKQRAGKYLLALNKKDFAIFKSFRVDDPLSDCGRCKKQKKRGRGRKGKGKRRSYKGHHLELRPQDCMKNTDCELEERPSDHSIVSEGTEECVTGSSVGSFKGDDDEDFSNPFLN